MPSLLASHKIGVFTITQAIDFIELFICPLDVQFVEMLDFQGFQGIEAKFSTKLSTDFLGQPQNPEKSTTYTPFQEFS
ncbi:hypothetical protein B9Z45_12575 [Limnohabitans sp. 2KL-17]|uniref:hypothetical protein n=1 Tax=Limnohabitans sp. 2KL-17 TaxID=1100704 RepID=UPI000D3AB757|nr:hypothetical protein [Limnohabitans sp. 2KL-17]PUE53545.1 hypothetical protein B9Z45_12575 [Limnohabitans sp. 2KL-17]